MINYRARLFQRLKFTDSRAVLVKIRHLETVVAKSDLPEKVKQLRTNQLRPLLEIRQAALFCYGMSKKLGQPVSLVHAESQDFDCVASWIVDDKKILAPLQLKEVVPRKLNRTASIQEVINKLKRLVDSEELTVAIHLNQGNLFEPKKLKIPPLRIAALWIFAAVSPDQSTWALWGNFLETPECITFQYPT